MRPVIMTPEIRAALKAAMAFAREHSLNMAEMRVIKRKADASISGEFLHDERQYVDIPVGVKVGITYEYQGPMGDMPCWHVSFSIDQPGRCIHPAAVDMILQEMGYSLKDMIMEQTYAHGEDKLNERHVVNLWFKDKKK